MQCHAISTLRNLAASSEKNKQAIVKAGAVQSIKELVLEVPMNVQSEMTACIAVLALSGASEDITCTSLSDTNTIVDEQKGQLLEKGICFGGRVRGESCATVPESNLGVAIGGRNKVRP